MPVPKVPKNPNGMCEGKTPVKCGPPKNPPLKGSVVEMWPTTLFCWGKNFWPWGPLLEMNGWPKTVKPNPLCVERSQPVKNPCGGKKKVGFFPCVLHQIPKAQKVFFKKG